MKKLLLALLAAAALSFHAPSAHAIVMMCAPDVSGAATGPRTIGGPNSAVPSQTLYVLNGQGCGLIQAIDIGYFASQGFTQASSQTSIDTIVGVQASGTATVQIGTLPAGAYIQKIIIQNTTANAAGSIAVGSTTPAGADIVAAVVCAANCLIDATLLKTAISATAATPIYVSSSAWGTSNVTVTVVYGYF